MADGWETKRRRTPGHDWTIVRLGAPATIVRVEVDTRRFKGNAPAACSLEACAVQPDWVELLPRTPLQADHLHAFDALPTPLANTTHVRLNIFPDGGVSRLRVFGRSQGRM
jgi:allantoicase